jgi:hypothetical protein
MSDQQADYFAVLGVKRDASYAEIRKAHHALARELHPDTSLNPDEERLKRVIAAWSVLKDDKAREAHKSELAAEEARRERQRQNERRRTARATEADPQFAANFGDALRGERPPRTPPESGPAQARPKPQPAPASQPAKEAYEGPRRLLHIVIAGCMMIGGVLLMDVAQANQHHDEITSVHSTEHYSGEALVAIFAVVLMVGGALWLLRELVQLVTDK